MIDVGAAALTPERTAVREWAHDKRVFLSSVMGELAGERRVLADAITDFSAIPVWFEDFGGRDDDPELAYVSQVKSSDIYLCLLGRSYGRMNPDGFSATHKEYLVAEQSGLTLSMWARDVPDREGHERTFLDEVRVFHVTGSFTDDDSLVRGVTRRLTEICAEELAPWVKVGAAVFRASHVRDTGAELHIRGRVLDDEVLSYLELLRGRPGYGAPGPITVTTAGRTRTASITTLHVSRTSRRGADVELELRARESNSSGALAMTYNLGSRSYTADDLVDISLRRALFGEPPPADVTIGLTNIASPWPTIAAESLSDAVASAVASILLAEQLGTAIPGSQLRRVRFGPARGGRRRCFVEWQSPHRPGYERPMVRHIEGALAAP